MTASEELLALARQRFGDQVSSADEKLFKAVARGTVADYSAEAEAENDPAQAADWGEDRVLQADRVSWICTDRAATSLVTHSGILVVGARIDGILDLEWARSPFPLAFRECAFTGPIMLMEAEINALNLSGTHVKSLYADGLQVARYVFLWKGFKTEGDVRFLGATIGSDLDCSGGAFSNPGGYALSADGLKVEGYVFLGRGFKADGEVRLLNATIGRNLDCTGGTFSNPGGAALCSDELRVEGSVYLREGFKAQGSVRLFGVSIGGNLECDGSSFINPGGNALAAGDLRIEGSVNLREEFKAEGEVTLIDASIGGSLACDGSTFSNPHGDAISADRVTVEGGVFLRNGSRAEGQVRLPNASIGGNLECDGSTFSNPDGDALNADGVKVEGGVFLRNGFRAEGQVRLRNARIGGNLECDGSTFSNRDGNALNADGVKVGSDVNLRNGFQAKGEVRLIDARIGGTFECDGSTFSNPGGDALSSDGVRVEGGVYLRNRFQAEGRVTLQDSRISGYLIWSRVAEPNKASLDLRTARIGTLCDEQKSWPLKGQLHLAGSEYTQIGLDAPRDAASRLEWLRLQPAPATEEPFEAQPYEYLAKVMRATGHRREATRVLVGKEDDRRRMGIRSRSGKIWSWLFGFTVGYGYRPERAFLRFAPLFLIVGAVLFWIGADMFSPRGVGPYASDVTRSTELASQYPPFYPIVYSIDAFVPIINLHQESHWLPNPNAEASLSVPWLSGNALRYYLWVHICFGWLLSFLLVAGLSGLVRKD
jgi:sRNA-binding regulator protein Hfq